MKSSIYIGTIIVLVMIIVGLLVLLYIGNVDYNNNTPNVIVLNEKVDNKLPVYPKDIPTYQNSNSNNDYQQIGTLINENATILPLFGRKINNNRWLYYTASETNNQLKIDVKLNDKVCKDRRIGCDELYDGDEVEVPAYNSSFKVTLYQLNDY
jgi:hypothetical protein